MQGKVLSGKFRQYGRRVRVRVSVQIRVRFRFIWAVGKMRNCGTRNAEGKMRNGMCGIFMRWVICGMPKVAQSAVGYVFARAARCRGDGGDI